MKRLILCLIIIGILFSLNAQQRADSALMRYLRGEGLIAYPARDVKIYTNGADKFAALFHDIDQAKKKIWVEYLLVANDSIGKLTLKHLEKASHRGVEVRLIVDDYKDFERGYGFRKPTGRDSIRNLGIDFVLFDRFKYPWLNHVCRDHRKIVNIDDSIGYIGGLNIADYYLNGNPKYGGWRDVHARITGPAVEGLAYFFQEHYTRSGGKAPYNFARYLFDEEYQVANPEIQVVYFERSRKTPKKQAETRNAIIAAFDAAKDTIRLVTPYFLPTHTVRQALFRAIDRGVHVEIMFSKVGDQAMLSLGNFHLSKRVIRHGGKVFLYKGAFHHSKIIMIDGQVSMVGSANLNSRSLKWDYEASSFIFNPKITSELNSIFENDKLQCDEFTKEFYKKECSFGFRFKGMLIDRFFTPIL